MGFRSDLTAAALTVLTTYQTANPTLLRMVKRGRVSQVGETPAVWIGDIVEDGRFSAQVRQREITLEITFIDDLADNSETENRLDDLVDAIWESFSAAYHAVSGSTEVVPLRVRPIEIEGPYRGFIMSVLGRIQEGRP